MKQNFFMASLLLFPFKTNEIVFGVNWIKVHPQTVMKWTILRFKQNGAASQSSSNPALQYIETFGFGIIELDKLDFYQEIDLINTKMKIFAILIFFCLSGYTLFGNSHWQSCVCSPEVPVSWEPHRGSSDLGLGPAPRQWSGLQGQGQPGGGSLSGKPRHDQHGKVHIATGCLPGKPPVSLQSWMFFSSDSKSLCHHQGNNSKFCLCGTLDWLSANHVWVSGQQGGSLFIKLVWQT